MGKCVYEVEVGGVGVPVVLAGVLLEEVDKGGMISRAILVYEKAGGLQLHTIIRSTYPLVTDLFYRHEKICLVVSAPLPTLARRNR